ncbi:MAG: tyrosine-type recombinase/integrase, partial [Rhizobiaceae bacterium]|nr:tyrosine-type recombinase/integrase [Rhizobiaceae bacterium]
ATGANLKDGILTIRTSKTGTLIKSILPRKLITAIKELSNNDLGYICTNTYGQPWTSDGFNASFFKFKKGLQDKGLIGENITFHGLRHTYATHLREENVTNEDIATALGHADPKTTNMYNKNVDTLKIQNKIVSIFDREENEK